MKHKKFRKNSKLNSSTQITPQLNNAQKIITSSAEARPEHKRRSVMSKNQRALVAKRLSLSKQYRENKQKRMSGIVDGTLGAASGAVIGAGASTGIGITIGSTMLPLFGTIAGAVVGAIAGCVINTYFDTTGNNIPRNISNDHLDVKD